MDSDGKVYLQGRLLDTMSFVDALPPFRMKQWQVIILLFLEALSVYRLPALTPHMMNRRVLFHKVRPQELKAIFVLLNYLCISFVNVAKIESRFHCIGCSLPF